MQISAHELTLVYHQSTGTLLLVDDVGNEVALARCYSGKEPHQNDPASEGIQGLGPIPSGMWKVGKVVNHPRLGAFALQLSPIGHDAYGRTGFFIHGDTVVGDGTASKGCIICPRGVRAAIGALNIKTLEVC